MFCIRCSAYLRYKTRSGCCRECEEKEARREKEGEVVVRDGSGKPEYNRRCAEKALMIKRRKALKESGFEPGKYMFISDAAKLLGFSCARNNRFERETKKWWKKAYYKSAKSGKECCLYVIPKAVVRRLKKALEGGLHDKN
jgi:hypothetical protein